MYPCLRGAALVRELHVYGQLIPTLDASATNAAQHVGFGRALMARAEGIAAEAGFTSVAVISGVGARNYYRRAVARSICAQLCALSRRVRG